MPVVGGHRLQHVQRGFRVICDVRFPGRKSNIPETVPCTLVSMQRADILGTDGAELSGVGWQPGAAPLIGQEKGGRSPDQATSAGTGDVNATAGGAAQMQACAESKIREFIHVSYDRIEGLVQAHRATDAGGKEAIEAHIREILEEIMAAIALAELLKPLER
ncbi:MAG TPA: hypothetical protein VNZ61_04745 [Roseomonas sp.]|nr:hypothetical protein [Roseomonas sp.]